MIESETPLLGDHACTLLQNYSCEVKFPLWFNFSCFYKCSRSLYILNLSILCMIVKAKKKIRISKNSEKKNRQISWQKKKIKIDTQKKQNLSSTGDGTGSGHAPTVCND